MLRKFEYQDLDTFDGNEFSDAKLFREMFDNDSIIKYSVLENEKVIAVIMFSPYWEDNHYGSFLISKDFKRPLLLKKYMFELVEKYNVQRIETDSINCDILNKWHRFLGFRLVGTKTRYAFGKDYNVWEWLNHGN